MYVFTITGGPPQREEVLREIKMKRFLNFYYATMKFLIFISFVVFGAAVYGPSSSMVDYTERRKTERERKGKCFPITGPPQREEVLCEKEKLNFKILFLKYATMNE